MNKNEDVLIADKIHFAVIAIEAVAQKMQITPAEVRRRLENVDLMKNLIFEFYDTLHTQSQQYVADVVEEALRNWEFRGNNNHIQKSGTEKGTTLC